ncbi:TPA: hypothetical protein ACI6QB_005194, partial [Klebsiella quasipneumoniae]
DIAVFCRPGKAKAATRQTCEHNFALTLPSPQTSPLEEGAKPKKCNLQGLPGGAALARAYR